jgi:hypothetical protein
MNCHTCHLRLICSESRDRSPSIAVEPVKPKWEWEEKWLIGGIFFGGFCGVPFALGLLISLFTNSYGN